MRKRKRPNPIVTYRRPFRKTEAADDVQPLKSDRIHEHLGRKMGLTHKPFSSLKDKLGDT